MPFYKKDDIAEGKIEEMKETVESKIFDENYIRGIIGKQKGELDVNSTYYNGKIAEGNWSLIKNDSDIKELDKETIKAKDVDLLDIVLGLDEYPKEKEYEYPREKDAEYQYVFIPSYYAVKMLILYYLENREQAKKIYGLKNAVVRRSGKEFYGGLPFILKYLKEIYIFRKSKEDSIKLDFANIMQKLLNCKNNNIDDDFINDIIDCIKKSHCGCFIIDKRLKDFEEAKEECYCIDFKEEIHKNGELLEYTLVDDYNILMHRDVKNDWQHLQKDEIKKAKEIINNTPKFPKNVPPRNDPLEANIKGWFSQKVSKKDRVVYKKESDKKTVYIATVCDHYKDAARRTKSKTAYK